MLLFLGGLRMDVVVSVRMAQRLHNTEVINGMGYHHKGAKALYQKTRLEIAYPKWSGRELMATQKNWQIGLRIAIALSFVQEILAHSHKITCK